jgi:hypothetical protein
MTPAEYRATIAALGFSQAAAGRFLTDNPRTSRRWASGESAVPKSVAMLLQVMMQHKLSAADVASGIAGQG